jgi:prepilin-type N-terminal cleavage/methylation domain-containing protein
MRKVTPKQRFDQSRRRGFTIVELLIVIVIIGILATIVIVAYNGIQQKARVASLQSDMSNAASQLEIDNVNNGTYPVSTAAANSGVGLKASPGTNWQYTYTSADNIYCLTGTNSAVSYFISADNPTPQAGACPGDVNGGVVALTCPSGFIVVPGSATYSTSDFCAMKYEAKQASATVPISQASGTPWVSISQTDAITYSANVAGCTGCHLITEAEWLTIAQNVLSVTSNWSGGSVGSGYIYSGHNDNSPTGGPLAASSNDGDGYSGTGNTTPSNQRRTLTLTNGEVIWDLAGNVYDWTSGQTSGGQPGASGYTWREWNTIAGSGSLSPSPLPSYGTPAASAWTSAQGIGAVYSNSDEAAVRGFLRGGHWYHGSNAGVLLLTLYNPPSFLLGNVGFRVAR